MRTENLTKKISIVVSNNDTEIEYLSNEEAEEREGGESIDFSCPANPGCSKPPPERRN